MTTSADQREMTGTLYPLIGMYLRERRSNGTLSPTSATEHRYRLLAFDRSFGKRPLTQLGPRAIDRYLETTGNKAPSTRCAYLATVRVFCRWLIHAGHIPSDPTAHVEPIRKPRSIPRALPNVDVAAVLSVCQTDRDRLIVWLMVGLGMRRGEVAHLRWEHYDPARLELTFTGKNSDERCVPVTQTVARLLERVRESGRTGPVIRATTHGGAMLPRTLGQHVTALMREAGIKSAPYDGVSAHAFRHTCATDVLDECQDLRVVQQMLGHSNLSTTAIYLGRVDQPRMRAAMEGRRYDAA